MSEWKETTLGELTTKIGSGATPRGGSNSYKDEGISLIRSQNVLDLQFTIDGLAFIDEEQAEGLKNVIVEKKDVLLNITGDSVARVCMVPNFVLPARVNQHVSIIRADKKKAIPEYLLYNLISQKEELLMQSEIGATRKAITKGMIEQFELKIPPLEEQRTIASILSSLDDKIDLLHRQNQTLEQLAETLFRQWFVEAADDSWKNGSLADWADNSRESIRPENISDSVRYVAMEHISKRSISLVSVGSSINIQSNKYKFNEGDILFGKLRPYFHKVCFASFSGVCSTDILVIRPKEAKMLPFCLFAFFQDEVINYVTAGSGGTRMPRTNWNDLSSFPFLKPPTSLIEKFNVTVQPFLEKIKSNQTQTRTLTALRDTLLPKLMSGEVWVEINTTVKMEEA